MADGKGRPFVPTVQIKDDLDKKNANNAPEREEWHKSIIPSLIIYTLALVFFIILTIAWIATHSSDTMTQIELTNSYIITALLLGIDGILLYGLFHGMEFMRNKAQRETLVNLSEHQATIGHFTQQLNHIMNMQIRFMDVLEERARQSYYQGVLSVQDDHSTEGSMNNTETLITEPAREEKGDSKEQYGVEDTIQKK